MRSLLAEIGMASGFVASRSGGPGLVDLNHLRRSTAPSILRSTPRPSHQRAPRPCARWGRDGSEAFVVPSRDQVAARNGLAPCFSEGVEPPSSSMQDEVPHHCAPGWLEIFICRDQVTTRNRREEHGSFRLGMSEEVPHCCAPADQIVKERWCPARSGRRPGLSWARRSTRLSSHRWLPETVSNGFSSCKHFLTETPVRPHPVATTQAPGWGRLPPTLKGGEGGWHRRMAALRLP